MCGWQKEERKVVQCLRSDLCVPGGGHENGDVNRGDGEFIEKYVGRILFSSGWHMSLILRRL